MTRRDGNKPRTGISLDDLKAMAEDRGPKSSLPYSTLMAIEKVSRQAAIDAREAYERELRENGYRPPILFSDPRDPRNILFYR